MKKYNILYNSLENSTNSGVLGANIGGLGMLLNGPKSISDGNRGVKGDLQKEVLFRVFFRRLGGGDS